MILSISHFLYQNSFVTADKHRMYIYYIKMVAAYCLLETDYTKLQGTESQETKG
jgi:hypothetical protein